MDTMLADLVCGRMEALSLCGNAVINGVLRVLAQGVQWWNSVSSTGLKIKMEMGSAIFSPCVSRKYHGDLNEWSIVSYDRAHTTGETL